MGIIRHRKERLAEQSKHAGENKYKIFWKDSLGKKHTAEIFWAKNDNEALDTLEIYKKKIQLIDPINDKEYFYGTAGNIIHDLGNGMEEIFDDMFESMESNETKSEKIKYFFMRIAWWFRDIKYMFEDFWYWFKHYDKATNKSHQRFESWDLNSSILDMLEFNIPIILSCKDGIPTDFCIKARIQLHSDDPNFDVKSSFAKNPNSGDDEMKLAERLWNCELEKILLHIRLYRYYSDFCIADDKDPVYKKINDEYKNTVPYKPGTDKKLDYERLTELTQREWNAIWDWWKQYGQMCWS